MRVVAHAGTVKMLAVVVLEVVRVALHPVASAAGAAVLGIDICHGANMPARELGLLNVAITAASIVDGHGRVVIVPGDAPLLPSVGSCRRRQAEQYKGCHSKQGKGAHAP